MIRHECATIGCGGLIQPNKTYCLRCQSKIANLEYIIRETLWMARRYATGRSTFAPGTLNECVKLSRDGAENTLYAADGMFGEWNPET